LFFFQKTWWAFALSLFAYGSILTFFGTAGVHELAHKTVFKARWINNVFLWITGLLGWFNFYWYNISHTYHHLYTLHPRGDREQTLPITPSLKFIYLLQLFTVNIKGGFNSIGFIPTVVSTFRLALSGRFGPMLGVSDN
jgi:fatty acid desaturase